MLCKVNWLIKSENFIMKSFLKNQIIIFIPNVDLLNCAGADELKTHTCQGSQAFIVGHFIY